MTILIIEDYDDLRELFSEVFFDLKCNVFTAKNGKEGFDLAHKIKFDVILCDVQMPEMDGMIFLKKIKASSMSDIPVHIMTGYYHPYTIADFHAAGAASFHEKPIHLEKVMSAFAKSISKK